MKASILRLYKGVKIDSNNVTNLSTTNLLNQLESHKVAEFSEQALILSNFTLQVAMSYFDIKDCNYMAFYNTGYQSKWYFAYITNISYVSDAVTEISFKFDNWSTYFSEINWLDCFVEREITASDTIGEHTLDEGLNVGRVETLETHIESIQGDVDDTFWIGMYTDYNLEDEDTFGGILTIINSNVSGHPLILFKITPETASDSINMIRYYLLKANIKGKIEDIKDMFIIPNSLVPAAELEFHEVEIEIGELTRTVEYYTLQSSIGADISDLSLAKKLAWDDFTPRNNKCYCYPFNFLYLTNNVGNNNIYKYEDFDENDATFRVEKVISIGGSSRIYPTNYKGLLKDTDEQVPAAKFPTCGWSVDSFTNWLTQNAINIPSKMLNVATGGLLSAANAQMGIANMQAKDLPISNLGLASTGASIGANLVSGVASIIGDFRAADLAPNIEGGSQNNGDVSFATGSNNFKFEYKRSRLETLKIIDDYFTKFGYKVSRIKKPNVTTSRFNHYYIKTAVGEKSVAGNMPQDSIAEINAQVNNGLTIWKNLEEIGNYGTI